MSSLSLHPYPAFKLSVLLASGIILAKIIPYDFEMYAGATAFFLLSSMGYFHAHRSPGQSVALTASCMLLWIALGATKLSFDTQSGFAPPDSLLDRSVVLVGKVTDAPHHTADRVRFVVSGSYVLAGSERFPVGSNTLVTLKIPRSVERGSYAFYGMTGAFRGRLVRPAAARNPGEFDQRRYYEANGISWLLSVRNGSDVIVLDSLGGSWLMRSLVMPARDYTLSVIDLLVGGQEGEFLKGILIGERGGITPEIREAFTSAGVAHILAVSGSNVAVVAGFIFFTLELLRLPRRLRIIAACAGVLWYMLLVGNQPSVVRATIMAVVLLCGGLFQEKPNAINSLGAAALIILLLDARQLFDVGFELSFLAVFSIIYLYPKMNFLLDRIPDGTAWGRSLLWTFRLCAVSLVATLGTLPLTAAYFGQVSIIGLLANIAVIPAAGLSLVLGFISTLVSLVSWWIAGIYAELNYAVLYLTLKLTVVSGNLLFSSLETLRFAPIDALPLYAAVLLLFHLDRKPLARALMIVFLVALNIWAFAPGAVPYSHPGKKLRVSFIDVGQGDAALVEFSDGKTMLIDAGPSIASEDAGKRVVAPFLKRRGISTIDVLVITHPHNDHLGGASAVLQQFDVLRVVDCGVSAESGVYHRYVRDILEERSEHRQARSGDLVEDVPEARVYVLSPGNPSPSEGPSLPQLSLNNASVVVRVLFGEISVLFTGDAEEEAEQRLVSAYGDFLKSTLLKVGHHGSSTSSTPEFIGAVSPRYAVISVGLFNRYEHPSPSTLYRLEQSGVQVSRTDEEGAIIFETDGKTLERLEWR